MNRRYVVISPCRNEAEFMRQTLDSVVAQSLLPAMWVIIDDGSTDNTASILSEYQAKFDWIRVITRKDRGHRAVGPGVVDAFYDGYNSINASDFEYLCKLDLDLWLPPRYFETLVERMEADTHLGTCSGKSYVRRSDGKLVSERKADDTSLGMTKFYRVSCFQEIGGFVREVMWDGIDCHRCRMEGWKASSWDEPNLRFIHLRPMGSSQHSIYVGRLRNGYGQYYMGTGILWMLATTINRLSEKPYVVGALLILWGWTRSWLKGLPRYEYPGFREFLNRYHCRALLLGKNRALMEIYEARMKK